MAKPMECGDLAPLSPELSPLSPERGKGEGKAGPGPRTPKEERTAHGVCLLLWAARAVGRNHSIVVGMLITSPANFGAADGGVNDVV